MKFEGSTLEERYNTFWNDEVVSSYKLLVNGEQLERDRFFSTHYSSTHSLIEKYCNGVMTIASNCVRQAAGYEDQAYIANYLASTKESAITDLNEFLEELKRASKTSPLTVELINNTKVSLASLKLESSNKVVSISSEESISGVENSSLPELSVSDMQDMSLVFDEELFASLQVIAEYFPEMPGADSGGVPMDDDAVEKYLEYGSR
ncbi:hypothetical protein [Legionella fallonii]|uniref:Uncharacterized protein n=1 Tax=Legionella fallonii LLAP-10 TaxID=1212491 RepID=A0A098G0V4_9GAMM|nr:hypothetical protein [Legionella fallonii]CEG56093.1 protein of unknown function [Legionella fallonii LLAP-10]